MPRNSFAACPPGNTEAGASVVAAGCPVSPLGYEAPPLGPDSLTWRYFGDWRGMLQGPWAGSMQNMHPSWAPRYGSLDVLPRTLAAPAAVVVPDRRRRVRRRPCPGHRRRGARLPRHHQGRRRAGPPLPRVEPRCLLLGTRHVLRRHYPCGRTVLRRADRSAEAPAVRRTHRVVSHVRHEHAAGADVVGGIPGLLGSHVPQRIREQLRGACRARSDRTAQAPFARWAPDWLWAAQRKLCARSSSG